MPHKQAHTDKWLRDDVAGLMEDWFRQEYETAIPIRELASDIIRVVRERVLREISTYARENIR